MSKPRLSHQWLKDHVGFDGPECLIWPFSRRWNGYGQLGLGNGKMGYPHRYMCELVHGAPPTPQHVAAHSCHNGKGGCVHPKHLSWITPSENILQRKEAGTLTKKRWRSIASALTPAQMAEIISLKGKKNQREIADMFGISYQHVSVIQNQKLLGGKDCRLFHPDEIRLIRSLKGHRSIKDLADEYGVSYHVIHKMQAGKSYRGI